MTRTKLAVLSLAALPVFHTVLTQGMEAPKPAKEMEQLAAFDGTWTCTGNAPAGPLGPAHATRSTAKFHKDLGGMWLSGTIAESASKENPQAFEGMAHMTYDAAGKGFVLLWVDNMGAWSTETSPGWQGDTMVWTGEGSLNGMKVGSRDTFTKKGADLHHVGEVQMDGKWVTLQDELCKGSAAKK